MKMSATYSSLARLLVGCILAICFLLGAELGQLAIFGDGHLWIENDGKFNRSLGDPDLWLPILGFVFVQGILVSVWIRLRRQSPTRTSIAPKGSSPMDANG